MLNTARLPCSLESYAPKINSASRVMVKRLAAFAGTGEHVDICACTLT